MLITKALLRGGIPLVIMSGIAFSLYLQGKYSDAKGTFMASLIAFFVGAATVIYNIDDWSFMKQSGVHFLIMLMTVYPVLLLSGWFEISSAMDAFKILLLFVSVGLVIWLVMYTLAKVFSW
ncbi:hypothetical protein JNUCC1_02699 [Lentibacillus sp. JNUCC-1]|uniref:DUF3021 family protein n=1 Tax=Lentibacillus sp. JNUCC-1 TaxID=2654513 RepID=UPI00132BE251|nr:DUF3021 family protein [Lentibacillus sp. JNUCC-1]MUV38828.1 hypothetical protein [Lentibacillus sp. JNUCC-1]